MTRRTLRQRGFTLIELIIFIVVVGVGVAGILSVYTTSIKNSADPLVRKQALAIAESLLEEIVLKDYCDRDSTDTVNIPPVSPPACGVQTVETSRDLFDDVDDYHGYTTTGIVDASGVSISGLSGYSIAPAVTVTTTTLGGVTVKQIVVSVTGPQGAISLTGYRGNY
jgi:MSHA pilin protein MshD